MYEEGKMMNLKLTKTDEGYSLVEVLVGIWLFSTIFIFVTGIFLNSYMVASYSPNIVRGTNIAQNSLVNLIHSNYSVLVLRVGKTKEYPVQTETAKYTVYETIDRKTNDISQDDYDILLLKIKVDWRDITQIDNTKDKAAVRMSDQIHTIQLQSSVSPVSQY
jgi:hypothetical protein